MNTTNLATNGSSKPSQGTRRRKQRQQRQWFDAYLLVAPALLMFSIFIIYPLFSTIYLSLFDYGLTDPRIRFVALNNFVELGSDRVFWRAIGNNFTILVVSVLVQVGLGIMLAAVIDLGARWGRSI